MVNILFMVQWHPIRTLNNEQTGNGSSTARTHRTSLDNFLGAWKGAPASKVGAVEKRDSEKLQMICSLLTIIIIHY